jgi:hypothetical protein
VRKIVVYELLSLDGVAEDPDSFFTGWDDALDDNLAAEIATQDAVILGRRPCGPAKDGTAYDVASTAELAPMPGLAG